MTPDRLVTGKRALKGRDYRFANFEITWAGECGWDGGLCFGSDDGRILIPSETHTRLLAESGEAINGAAFLGPVIAVSTRAEVAFWQVDASGHRSAVYGGGAHGVISTPSGKFLAPLGRNGLLEVTVGPEGPSWRVAGAAGQDLNFYKIALVGTHEGREVLACALRGGGWASWVQDEPSDIVVCSSPDLDAVDVCPLRSERFPRAAVVLGIDNSLHIVEDVTATGQVKILHVPGLRGTGYRLLSGGGDIFLLTSESLYHHLGDLLRRCLEGERVEAPTTVWGIDLEAVDASVAHDRTLLVVRPDGGVTGVAIDDLAVAQPQGSPLTEMPVVHLDDVEWKTFDLSAV
jgi:hypothetical protein